MSFLKNFQILYSLFDLTSAPPMPQSQIDYIQIMLVYLVILSVV